MSLKGVAEETLRFLEAGEYTAPSGATVSLQPALRQAVEGTRLYTPEQAAVLLETGTGSGDAPRIEVTDETTQVAAQWLAANGPVCVLNFASARNPGGGFLGGAKAQEEDVARCSGLYPCLRTQPTYYTVNRATKSLLYTDHLIYSPGVPFFRTRSRNLLEAPFLASVVTAPAPNAGEVLLRDLPDAAATIEATYRRRAGLVLGVARDQGERTLVLGAWGCGVFRNDPEMAADAFGEWLGGPFRGAFEQVVFAVYERGGEGPRLTAFRERFR